MLFFFFNAHTFRERELGHLVHTYWNLNLYFIPVQNQANTILLFLDVRCFLKEASLLSSTQKLQCLKQQLDLSQPAPRELFCLWVCLLLLLWHFFFHICCFAGLNKVKHHTMVLPYIPNLYVLVDFILLLITAGLEKHRKSQRRSLKMAPMNVTCCSLSLWCFQNHIYCSSSK